MTEFHPTISYQQGARIAAAAERIADAQEGKTNGLSTLEQQIAASFAIARTGKVYKTKFYKFATNTTSSGIKESDNAGLTCVPSTDTVEGQDDYADIPVFKWTRCNYTRDDADGFARPTALENWPGYATTGAVDVGVLHMTFYWMVYEHATYEEWILSDTPHDELGLVPFCDAIKSDGTVMPYFVQSAYPSVTASDGNLRSQPDTYPAYNASYNNNVTNYQKKGKGYWGAGASRNLFWHIMSCIKYASKSSQAAMRGCADYNAQEKCTVAESGVKRVLVTSSSPWYVGGCVSVGVANGSSKDRGNDSMNSVCNRVRIKSVESVTVSGATYTALNLDIDSTINTTTSTYVSAMPCWSGETDAVIGHHDGSYLSYTDGCHTLRICGQEYQWGQYFVASDTVIKFSDAAGHKDVYTYPRGIAHVKDSVAGAVKVGSIPEAGDYWIGDEQVDISHGILIPGTKGSGDTVGVGDYCWGGGTPSAGELREYLMTAALWDGGYAGACPLNCGGGLGGADWDLASCD